MAVMVTLGEPLWRDCGRHQLSLELEPGESVPLRELAGRIGLEGWTTEGLLVVVNERLVPAGEADRLMLHDGDHVVLQLMLAGG